MNTAAYQQTDSLRLTVVGERTRGKKPQERETKEKDQERLQARRQRDSNIRVSHYFSFLGMGSLQEGSMEFMLQRRLLYDDHEGVGEPLNETVREEREEKSREGLREK